MFKNQIVAITGASGGIGRGIAEMFVKNGATVAISDLQKPSQTASEIGATAFACDVSDAAQCQALVDQSVEAFGAIDVFVNNAGIGFMMKPLLEVDTAKFLPCGTR